LLGDHFMVLAENVFSNKSLMMTMLIMVYFYIM